MSTRDLLSEDAARSARVAAAGGPIVAQGKSLQAAAAAWLRGDDFLDSAGERLSQPYAQSGLVYAATNLVSGEFTGLPVRFYQGDEEYTESSFAAWWGMPALGVDRKRLTRAEVDRLLALWLQIEGEFFILLDDSWVLTAARRGGKLPPFIIAPPGRMRLVIQSGILVGYVYSDPSGRQVPFVPEQVIHKKEPNPYDDWRGLGRAQVAKVATEGAFLTGVYIRDLMRNNGDQGFIVVGKSGAATDPQREQIVADLRSKRAALRRGVAKDLFLTGDITVERKKEEAASVDLVNTKTLSHQEIFMAFGVPPSMATVKSSYSIGKDSDRYQLVTGTSQPLARQIDGAYSELAQRQTGLALEAEHDWDAHPVMQEVRNSRIEAAIKLWATGWPWEKINAYLDLGMQPFEGWNVAYLPFSVAPVGDPAAAEPTADPALAEPALDDADVAKIKLALMARQRIQTRTCINVTPRKSLGADPLAAFQCQCGDIEGVAMKGRSPREIARWRDLMSKRRGTVKSFEAAFGRVLSAARQETLRKLAESAPGKAIAGVETKTTAKGILFDLAKFSEDFSQAMRDRQKSALDAAGSQLFAEVGKDDVFKFPPSEVLDYLAGRENKLADTPRKIHEEIKAAIEEGLLKGDPIEQLAARVRVAFNGVTTERARRIAMTETAAAYGAGRDVAMQQAGVQRKRWLTSGNDNVRSAHAEANGQTVAIDEAFEVGGEELMFPGDDAGSAENVINCHCVSIAVVGDDAA